MSAKPPDLPTRFRSLPPPLKFVAGLYLTTALCLGALAVFVWVRHSSHLPDALTLFAVAALEVLFTAGILQRSNFLRWTCVAVAAGTLIAVLLRAPPWATEELSSVARGWMKLALSVATLACLMSGSADRWYRGPAC